MADMGWINNVVDITKKAMVADGICDVVPGTVIRASPVQIQIDQKCSISGSQVLLSEDLTDHKITMTIPGIGKTEVVVHNALKTGDKVLMVQKTGGQQYLVVCKW